MLIIRPIEPRDIEEYIDLAEEASLGLTSLPKQRDALEKRIALSQYAFAHKDHQWQQGLYLFVAEEMQQKKIVGTAAITASHQQSRYYFQIGKEPRLFFGQKKQHRLSLLYPIEYKTDSTEIGGLFLQKNYRYRGMGKGLSLSRFFFMHCFPNRFMDPLFTELRGVIVNGKSPFWNHVGYHFCPIDLEKALQLRIETPECIPQFLPKHPLYVSLLHPEAQKAIGQTNQNTQPAYTILTQQGFVFSEKIDVFDAGPRMQADRENIPFLRKIRETKIKTLTTVQESDEAFLVSNTSLHFRSCHTPGQIDANGEMILPPDVAEALLLQKGDRVCYVQTVKE